MSRPSFRLAPSSAFIALCVAAAPACAQSRSAMPLGAEAAPPAGVIDYCRRDPEACRTPGSTVADVEVLIQAAARVYWRQLFDRSHQASPPGATSLASGSARQPAEVESRRPTTATSGALVERRSPQWSAVTAVNAEVNAALRAEDDLRAYRQADYWTIPRATGRARPVGDCEDFALTKRERLIAQGVPAEALSIALVTTRTGLSHAVLLVATDQGEYVLDNLTPWVVHWTEARLTWRERQAPGQMLTWVHVAAE